MPYPPFYSTYPPGFGVYGQEEDTVESDEGSGAFEGCAPCSGDQSGCIDLAYPYCCYCPPPFEFPSPPAEETREVPSSPYAFSSYQAVPRRRRPRYVKATRAQKRGRGRGRYVRASKYGQAATSSEPALMSLGVAVGLGWLVGRM